MAIAVNEIEVVGRAFRKLADQASNKWYKFSLWTKGRDVEFDDGKTAEEKVGAINGITSDVSRMDNDIASSILPVHNIKSNLDQGIINDDLQLIVRDGKLYWKGQGADSVEKKLGSDYNIIYNHEEISKQISLTDTSGNGFSSSQSNNKNESRYGTLITLDTVDIPLYDDTTDPINPALLYSITFYYTGTGNAPAYSGCRFSIDGGAYLYNENNQQVLNTGFSVTNGSKSAPFEKVIKLTDYNIGVCDKVRLNINARAMAHGSDSSVEGDHAANVSFALKDYVTLTYWKYKV